MRPALRFSAKAAIERIRARFAGFAHDRRGATAVEFAMISLPFLGLLFALFQTAFVFFATEAVGAAAEAGARAILTGQVQGNSAITSAAQFRDQVICNPSSGTSAFPSFLNCSNLIVDVRTAGNSGSTAFGSADVAKDYYTNPTMQYCTGGPGDVVVVRVVYPLPVYMPIISGPNLVATGTNTSGQTMYNGKWTYLVMGASAFRNEPFPTGTIASGCS